MINWPGVPGALACVFGAVLASGVSQDPERSAPTFKAESHVVSFEFSSFRSVLGIRMPNKGIRASEIIFVLDDRTYPPEDLRQFKPGHYLVSFIPPDAYRDGMPHEVLFHLKQFKRGQGWKRTFTIPRQPGASPDP